MSVLLFSYYVISQIGSTTAHPTTKAPTKAAQTTTAPSSFCLGKKDGNYVDPSRCDGFISCVANKVHKMDCPHGLWYNVKIDACDWPRNVQCKRKNDLLVFVLTMIAIKHIVALAVSLLKLFLFFYCFFYFWKKIYCPGLEDFPIFFYFLFPYKELGKVTKFEQKKYNGLKVMNKNLALCYKLPPGANRAKELKELGIQGNIIHDDFTSV